MGEAERYDEAGKMLLLWSEGPNIISRQICGNEFFQINLTLWILITSDTFWKSTHILCILRRPSLIVFIYEIKGRTDVL